MDTEEYLRRVERMLTGEFKSTGKLESGFWQRIGKFIESNSTNRGKMFEDILLNVERTMVGKKKHGFEQNKMSDMEKHIKDWEKENGRN